MLLVLGSRERTELQYRNLLRNSGFRMTRVVQPPRHSVSSRQQPRRAPAAPAQQIVSDNRNREARLL
jgi:hypothetical protein